jgi:hypothetical protein
MKVRLKYAHRLAFADAKAVRDGAIQAENV